MRSNSITYEPRIDHLRFFAALLVMTTHFFLFQSFRYAKMASPAEVARNARFLSAIIVEGHTGVSLFLVLSGFIFTLIGYGRMIDYRRFIANRALRIMPLYVLVIAAAAIFSKADIGRFLSFGAVSANRG